MVNIAVIYLSDVDSTEPDNIVNDLRVNNIVDDSNLPFTIIIPDFGEEKLYKIFY